MARSFVRVDVTRAITRLDALERSVRLATQDLQMEAADAGVAKMKELIETRGTGRLWTRQWYAKELPNPSGSQRSASLPGRVNTGKMRDAVRARSERGPQKTISAFGWIDNVQPYFYAQEYGFTAGGMRRPMLVQGMFALRDARLYVSQIIPKLAKKYQNRIARGKY